MHEINELDLLVESPKKLQIVHVSGNSNLDKSIWVEIFPGTFSMPILFHWFIPIDVVDGKVKIELTDTIYRRIG